MSIYRADSLQLSFLDEIFSEDFPELPSILMQCDDTDYTLLDEPEEPINFGYFENQMQDGKKNKRKTRWTQAEDSVIVDLVEKYGHSWKYFTKYLPERPADSIKSRYYSYLKKRHCPQPRKNLSMMTPNPPCSLSQMTDDKVVESMLNSDLNDAASTCSHTTADQGVSQDNNKKAVLMRLYAKMSSLEKVLAKTYLEIDRLQTSKGSP